MTSSPFLWMTLAHLLLPLVTCLYQSPRTTLVQQQVCYFQPFSKELVCRCPEGGEGGRHGLRLELRVFIRDQGQEVQSVLVESCPDLVLSLNLTQINPTNIPIKIKNGGSLKIEQVIFDPAFSGHQKLALQLKTVTNFIMEDVEIDEAIQISAIKVKQLLLSGSTFSHLPLPGLELQETDKLIIMDSVFTRISPGSVNVGSTKDVVVVNNQFNINAIQVVNHTKGSSLHISCNRLLGEQVNPDCVTISFSTAQPPSSIMTTASPPSPTTPPPTFVSAKQSGENMVSVELLVGVVAGVGVVLLLLIILLVLMYCRHRRKKKEDMKEEETIDEVKVAVIETGENSDTDTDSGNDGHEGDGTSEGEERRSLLVQASDEEVNIVEATKPRFSTPIWLDEIHSNKIFNKQRSINTIDPIDGEEQKPVDNETPKRRNQPFPVRSISEIIEDDDDFEEILEPATNQKCSEEITETQNFHDVISGCPQTDIKRLPTPETDL